MPDIVERKEREIVMPEENNGKDISVPWPEMRKVSYLPAVGLLEFRKQRIQ